MGLLVLALALFAVGSLLVLTLAIRHAVPDPFDGDDDEHWRAEVQRWKRREWRPPPREPVRLVLERYRRVGHD